MPHTGQAAFLLRRLSTGDKRFKGLSTKETLLWNPSCSHRDLELSKSSETPPIENPKHTNTLISEKSPYLLQHARDPVQWHPWGQEAIGKAKKENKLIFLSVGYSTCHWCHVMEKESFENEDVAKIMNDHSINIKVDREERPDIDRVYMLFVMATTGGGGWPMSVLIIPDLRPVTGGTYFPPEHKRGKPGFKSIMLSLATKWMNNKQQFLEASTSIMEELQKIGIVDPVSATAVPGEATWDKCVHRYISSYKSQFGGFGTTHKFPQASIFNCLFHYYARDKTHPEGQKCLDMCLHTLGKIAKECIHENIPSALTRYSVDNDWHVPHFEKMLYDQAQLTVAYTDAYLATKDEFYADVVRDIVKYVNRYLRHKSGGFYSAEDADSYPYAGASEKKEGAFCIWEYDELKTLLEGKKINDIPYLDVFADFFSVEEDRTISRESDPHEELTGKISYSDHVLNIYSSKKNTAKKFGISVEQFERVLAECVGILYEERQKRPRPHLDTKMLCSWNGLMIAGLARAGQALEEKDFVDDAIKTAQFIKDYLYDPSTNTLLHSCYKANDGSVAQTENPIKGFLDDYAFLIKGLLDLYEASLDARWLQWARELQTKQDELFWDQEHAGVSCLNLQRLAACADRRAEPAAGELHRDMAKQILQAFAKRLNEMPTALPEMMSALMFYNDSPTRVLISGGCTDPGTLELVRVVWSRLLPARVLRLADPAAAGAAAGAAAET
ncbi:Uncharacterized protein OBRU01_09644, partial [Operophtera brumata]